MSDAQDESTADTPPIPPEVVARYVDRYPHLARLALRIEPTEVGRKVAKRFARKALNLWTPKGIKLQEYVKLGGVAEGTPWPDEG